MTRKVFQNFAVEADSRAFQAACEEQPNDTFREICVSEPYEDDPGMEYLRQWLLNHGAKQEDEYVFVEICW